MKKYDRTIQIGFFFVPVFVEKRIYGLDFSFSIEIMYILWNTDYSTIENKSFSIIFS